MISPASFARLPGIGRKTAQRLVFHLLRQPPEQVVAWPNRWSR
jgi:recombinational DNA repair protein RecR